MKSSLKTALIGLLVVETTAFGSTAGPSNAHYLRKMVAPSGLASTVGALGGATIAATVGTLLSAHDVEASSNVLFSDEPIGMMVFACAVSGTFLAYSREGALDNNLVGEDEACIIKETEDEHVCGPVSFDSTDDGMVCVEVTEGGKLRWECA